MSANFSQSADIPLRIKALGAALTSPPGTNLVPEIRKQYRALGEIGALDVTEPPNHSERAHAATSFYDLGLEADTSTILSLGAHFCAGVVPFLSYAGPHLREKLQKEVRSGRAILANAITEEEAGSDLTVLKTTAVKDGQGYILNGNKRYVTNAAFAHYAIVFCCTDAEAGYLGSSAILVDLNSPGVQVGVPYAMAGARSAHVASITFENCRVPAENLLGEEGDGTRIFTHSMLWERTVMFSGFMGMLQRSLDSAVRFANARVQRGSPISKYQAVSHKLADCSIDIAACRALIAAAVNEDGNSPRAALLAIQAKINCSEAFMRISRKLVSVYGGFGIQCECPAAQLVADSLASGAFSGANDTLRNAIATRIGL